VVSRFTVSDGDERLDRVVHRELSPNLGISRSQVERLIEAGKVCVDGRIVTKPAYRVDPGAVVDVAHGEAAASPLQPFQLSLSILYEDDYLLVVNKPAGISMHPGAGNRNQTLANAVVHYLGEVHRRVGASDRPGIVHRLDKDTTGVVVIAKTTPVHAHLSQQFAERSIQRSYTALVFSTPRAKRPVQTADSGEVRGAIGRHPTQRTLMSITESGKPAVTEWHVVERFSYGTLLTCRLQTGRTHQIRVHMNSIGCPIIGDQTYGDFSNLPRTLREAADAFGRQALHAATLSFIHPVSASRLSFEAPIPDDFRALVEVFRAGEQGL
jgi:23S rRNA pseudouridine1911/1915/1917 synthase